MTSPLVRQGFPVVPRRIAVDLLIAATLFAGSSVWADRFWNAWIAEGGKPVFYQSYFEPAVMIACGRGFVISTQTQPKSLEDFLFQRRDTFDCADIPADHPLGTRYLYQGAWTYLLVSVGYGWRLLGISWSGMGPMFGALFGAVIALAYGIFRLGMGRALAIVGAVFLTLSSLHLVNLPHLRDYAKAPFTLALVLLAGLLVTLPVRNWTVLALATVAGVVSGVGYGFRTDLLINLPFMLVVILCFLDGGLTRNLRLKAASAVLFVATFAVVSWPVTSTVYRSGGCQWHVTLLGLQSPFDSYLRVRPAPYDFGYAYADGYVDRAVNGYQYRTVQGAQPMVFCSHEYDVQSGRYLQAILLRFPADILVRSYASVLQIVELPFHTFVGPLQNWLTPVYTVRAWLLEPDHRWGLWFTAGAIVLTGMASIRLALVLMLSLVYFGGYPAIQFQPRHYFHLEFIGWWAIGFVLHQALRVAREFRHAPPDVPALARAAARSGVYAAIAALIMVAALGGARWYQARQVRQLLDAYLAAPKEPVTSPGQPLPKFDQTEWPQLLQVDLNEAACGGAPAVRFRYDEKAAGADFTHTVKAASSSGTPGTTRLFMPVFETYLGLDLVDPRPGCLTGVSRVTDLKRFPVLLGVTLASDWASHPLYQQLTDWESDGRP
ncbi:MAG: hypothetical protein Q8T13_00400 [Acidobacteriota bacterium]|nr:hypothetical protein [Acidobacteriota bacterium]